MSELYHYGTPRKSGRYPWGSGENPYQHEPWFNQYVSNMRKSGMTDVEIAKLNGMTTTELRNKISISKAQQLAADQAEALRLKDRGYSTSEVARRMGKNESTVRNLLNPAMKERGAVIRNVVVALEDSVKKNGYVDIGVGSESYLGISRTKLQAAVSDLKSRGYTTHSIQIEQPFSPGKYTNVLTLAPPETTLKQVYDNKDKISTIGKYSEDLGKTFLGIEKPRSISSDRIEVAYKENGGSLKDGTIELRRGVAELDLGDSKYAQVRIAVDDTHYLKGVAIYSDDLPKGIDIRYNTNKSQKDGKLNAMKALKDDPDNPFKSTIRQKHYVDENGKTQLSALNIVGSKDGSGEEGSWDKWSKNISTQVLSKQPTSLAKKQLDIAYNVKKDEYNTISSLTNPAVKKKLLETFADQADSASVHLKAAALPRQRSQLILPVPSIRETQVYAPNFKNGEKVVLIRHPHGGKFEIPELTVNNNHPTAKKILGNAKDAIGINPNTAERLSGADFDGDTVIVIPNNNKQIKTSAPLKGLVGFDPKQAYPAYDGMKKISPSYMQTQMGEVSNLITDMTIRGANQAELARAVRHSMVIIDSEKHNLNYKQSYIDNGITELKKKYQNSARGGASTLISRASSQKSVPLRKEGRINPSTGRREYIDPKTGRKLYTETGESYINNRGNEVLRTTKSTKMAETTDAFTLSSGSPIETVYANHANRLKALANQARKDTLSIKPIAVNPSSKRVYATEVASLNSKLNLAVRNKPLERQAQIQTNVVVSAKRKSNPNLTNDDVKKIKTQALSAARARVGAKKESIDITPNEWKAIQAGAISNSKLTQILNNVKDLDQVKKYATPRESKPVMTSSKISRAKALLANGYTQAEVASMLGVSISTMMNAISK